MTRTRAALSIIIFGAFVCLHLGSAVAAPPAPDKYQTASAALDDWRLTAAADEIEKVAAGAKSADDRARVEVLRARLAYQRSRFAEAVAKLPEIVQRTPGDFEARVVLGRALLALGKTDEAVAAIDPMADAYNDDRVTSARDLGFLGIGLQLTGYVKNANRVFQEALDKDKDDVDAKLAWADLFLTKYNYRDADRLYREALAQKPGDVRADVGVARVAIASDNAFSEASEILDKVLARAPECVPAHNLMALIDLQNERPEAAIERLSRTSLTLAPQDPEALALNAAAYFLLDDDAGFRAAESKALAVNPKNAALYVTVADHGERVHRYTEAKTLYEKAQALDPEAGDAVAGIGVAWSRLGDDEKARRALEQAFDLDPYNVKTYNLLEHFYAKIDKDFVWLDAPPMKVRVDKNEAPVLERYVPRLLDEAWKHFTKKYGFKPKLPVHVEIFSDVETFAVRSVGLPGLAAHGICFGHVITARSPSAGDFNWAEVLWHELAHVFHIQLSQNRVPRWFTEGFAVYESLEGRTSWAREMDVELYRALKDKRLRGIADFNLAFTQAKSMDDILVAYYHAYMVARFLNTEWGFPKVKRMLELWGERQKTPAVVQAALGVDIAELDRRMFAWLEKELAYVGRAYPFDLGALGKNAEIVIAKVENPAEKNVAPSARVLAEAAAAKLTRGDASGAEALAETALRTNPDEALALFVRGALRLAGADQAGGRADYERLVTIGSAGVDVLRELAKLAAKSGDTNGAIGYLTKALELDPKQIESYDHLADALQRAGQTADAFAVRARQAEVDQMNAPLAVKLLEGAEAADAKKPDVLRWGELAVHVAPFVHAVHVAFAKAALAVGAKDAARFEAESALVIDPQNADAKALLGH